MSVWDLIAGQERARAILEPAASAPADAFLFSGPPGVGKAEAARVFAAAIICPDQCGTCSICTRVMRGIHPDVQIFQPEGLTYPVELIREMVAAAARTPLEAQRRVLIVEEADRIVERSQNALLKALEEPNPSVTWILVADAIDPFLPTILSRCRTVEFAAVPEDQVAELLRSRFDLDPSQTEVIVRAARGDLERAIHLAADERVRKLRDLAVEAAVAADPSPEWALSVAERVKEAAASAREAEGQSLTEELGALEDSLGSTGSWRKRVLERHRRVLRKVETEVFAAFLVWLSTAFRDLAAASSGGDRSDLTTSDRAEEITAAAPGRPTAAWLDMCEAALDGQLAIIENANPALVVESVLMRLVTLGALAGVAQG